MSDARSPATDLARQLWEARRSGGVVHAEEAVHPKSLAEAYAIQREIVALSGVRLNVGIVGFVLATWGSLGIFGAITSAINHAWGVEKRPSFWKHKLIALTILATAGVLLMVTLVVTSSVQLANTDWFIQMIDSVPVLAALRGFAVRNLPVPMFMFVAGLLYYAVPNAKVRLRDVWAGAFVAAVLWRVAFAGFSWYAGDLTRFKVLGPVAAVALFLVWIYLSAVIFLYGVEVTAAYSRLRLQHSTPPPPRDA